MQPLNPFRTSFTARLSTVALLGFSALSNPAQAVLQNQMQATASQNTIITADQVTAVSNTIPVTVSVSPSGGSALASARITSLNVASASNDVQSHHLDGSAVQYSSFQFWNTSTNSAYTAAELAGASLILDFALQGWAKMPVTGNARSTSYSFDTQLYIGTGFDTMSGGASLSCGPVGPCSAFGSPTLNIGDNSITSNFSLTKNITADNGLLFTQLFIANGGGPASAFSLNLTGLRYSGKQGLNLGLKFNDGSIVRTVPLPGAALMMLSGLGLLGLRIRRRATAA